MFGLKTIVSCLCLVGGIFASPVAERRADVTPRSISLSGWGGLGSFGRFDDFLGIDNFDGRNNIQTVIIQENLVCSAVDIRFIQQKLIVLQEVAKQIILQQICDVELQVVVLNQFRSGHDIFLDDLLRNSGRNIGFDNAIASRFGDVFRDGSLSDFDLGFGGLDVGSNLFVPSGNNWVDDSRRVSVESALQASEKARRRED